MEFSPKYLDPQTLAKVERLELRARRVVDGVFAGQHRGRARGSSNEFFQHREYAPGDDLRHVDWKVFARTDKHHLKQFEHEANLNLCLVLDVSESMAYQGPKSTESKIDYARCVVAALAWMALRQRDRVCLMLGDRSIHTSLPPSNSPASIKSIVTNLELCPVSEPGNLPQVLTEVAMRLKQRSIVLVVSDFFDDLDGITKGVRQLQHAQHDTRCLQVLDSAEIDFPFNQQARFRGLEGKGQLTIDPRYVRGAYRRRFAEFCDALRIGCLSNRTRFQQNRTNEPLEQVIAQLLLARDSQTYNQL